jgi:nucleoside-diphosphate-sugar epimerase
MRHPEKRLFDLPREDLRETLRGLEKDWPEWQGRRIFISGGTGFFGKWLLGALAFADAELGLNLGVTVLSRHPARFLEKYPEGADHRALQFEQGNVAEFQSRGERYDFIIHGATDTLAITTTAQEEARARDIVRGTERMLDLATRSGAQRMLNISSGGIYGAAAGKMSGAREEDEAEPVTSYGRAKLEAERLCAESAIDASTARAFAFLGPHLPLEAHYAAGNFLRDAGSGGPILVRGDGTALRSYLYPTDLVIWLLRILLHGERRAYNVGSDEVVSTAELARRIAAVAPGRPEIIIQSTQAQGPQNIYLPDISRAGAELGLKVQVRLDEAIRRTLAWLEQTPRTAG